MNSCPPDQGLGALTTELASRVLTSTSFGRFSTSSWLLHHVQNTRIVPDLPTPFIDGFCLQPLHSCFPCNIFSSTCIYSCFLENSLWCDYYIGSLHCKVYTAFEGTTVKNNTLQSSGDVEEGFPVLFRSCFLALLYSLKALSACFSHQEKLALSYIYVPVIYPIELKSFSLSVDP